MRPTLVADPARQVTDQILLSLLARRNIDWRNVEFVQDYSSRPGKESSPYAKFYLDHTTGLCFAVISQLPMVNARGKRVSPKWLAAGPLYRADANQFEAQVIGSQVTLRAINDQPWDGRTGESITWNPRLYLAGVEIFCGPPSLLPVDPVNSNYQQNTLEWDYGICKRRLRLIEGRILERWVFAANPGADVRIKYNQSGTLKLRLGAAWGADGRELTVTVIADDEERISTVEWNKAQYPVEVADSQIFYPDAHPETSSVDGQVRRAPSPPESWAVIRSMVDAANLATDNSTIANAFEMETPASPANTWDYFARGFWLFNTASLPDNATVIAATLALYGQQKIDGGFGGNLDVVSSNPASNTQLVIADYTTQGTTSFGSRGFASLVIGAYNQIALNSAGIAAISKTGVTKFGTTSSQDRLNQEPPWQASKDHKFAVYCAEQGTGYKPKLIVVYSVPGYSKPFYTYSFQWNDGYYNMCGQIMKVGADTLSYFYCQDAGHSIQPGKVVKRDYTISTKTWGNPVVVHDCSPNVATLVAGGIIGSRIYLFFSIFNSTTNARIGLYWMRSTDLTGTSWSALTDITALTTLPQYNVYGPIIPTDDPNTFLVGMEEYANDLSHWHARLIKTTDGGNNWVSGSYIYDGSLSWGEPAIVYLGNGNLLALLRRDAGTGAFLGQSTSTDNGQTWTTPASTNLGYYVGQKMGHMLYWPATAKIILAFWDRTTGSGNVARLLATAAKVSDVFNNPTGWPSQTIIDDGENILNGYPTFADLGSGNYFGVYTVEVTTAQTDTYGFTMEFSAGAISKRLLADATYLKPGIS